MFSNLFHLAVTSFFDVSGQVGAPETYLVSSCIFFFLALLVWRVLAFTVLPSYRPYEPREVPYWIPCE